ncbi:hypothetical protein NDU88_003519 [Pleurodeles waltl]|uniref:Uncharacterized protein n=1 Tax=Pleurodeles waltl TaxID=8319 RepID=A0AAV7PCB5_PLEWA|nr:hypothetical protein NDU88_003519 [Pleurodeles waltl]
MDKSGMDSCAVLLGGAVSQEVPSVMALSLKDLPFGCGFENVSPRSYYSLSFSLITSSRRVSGSCGEQQVGPPVGRVEAPVAGAVFLGLVWVRYEALKREEQLAVQALHAVSHSPSFRPKHLWWTRKLCSVATNSRPRAAPSGPSRG